MIQQKKDNKKVNLIAKVKKKNSQTKSHTEIL